MNNADDDHLMNSADSDHPLVIFDKDEEIYVDFYADELADIDPQLFGRGLEKWGEYEFKPSCQTLFERQVQQAAIEIAASDHYTDVRPRMQDKFSGKFILIDSGAAVSCWPARQFPDAQVDPSRNLQAVNGATLPTFGTKSITFKVGNHIFTHDFILSTVRHPWRDGTGYGQIVLTCDGAPANARS